MLHAEGTPNFMKRLIASPSNIATHQLAAPGKARRRNGTIGSALSAIDRLHRHRQTYQIDSENRRSARSKRTSLEGKESSVPANPVKQVFYLVETSSIFICDLWCQFSLQCLSLLFDQSMYFREDFLFFADHAIKVTAHARQYP
jgi:hypothetical protein